MINILNIYITYKDDVYYDKYEIPCLGESIKIVYRMIRNFISDEARYYISFKRTQKEEEDIKTPILNPDDITEAIQIVSNIYPNILRDINNMNEYYKKIKDEEGR